jgi:type IV pilus assembly protein PilC
MAIFSYRATNNKAEEVIGMVEADTLAVAVHLVREMGYFPVKIYEDAGRFARKRPVKVRKLRFAGRRIKKRQISAMTRQLATLIDAGLPLVRSLSILHHQEKPGKLKAILDEMRSDIGVGKTFSESLAKHPKVFDKLYVNMIRAGEAGGLIEVVLSRLAEFAERRAALARKVKGAMVYPAAVLTVAACIVAFLLIRVVPVFQEIYADIGLPLPRLTQSLINVSGFLRDSYLSILLGSTGIFLCLKLMLRMRFVCLVKDRVALRLPAIENLVRKVGAARFARTLGTLVASGVPILQSLSIVKETIGNEVMSEAVARVHDSVREGETIAGPLEESNAFPYMAVNMIEVGEETGKLDAMLLKLADIYDAEVEAAIDGIVQLIEPVMVVFLGVIVGFIVVAMYLPLFGMAGGDIV